MSNQNPQKKSLRAHMHALKNVRLTEQEQSAMKSRLLSYADMHTARSHARGILSPFSFEFSSRLILSGSLAVLLLVGTTGVTLAAQDTLPGQPLYAVKVNVTEPIEGAVITVTTGKAGDAAWQNTLAARRLQEAAQLAANNQLASSTQTYLAQQVALHVHASEEDTNDLAQSGATTSALQARADLAARLSAHAQVLAVLADKLESAGNASTTGQVALLIARIRGAEEAVMLAASSTELSLQASSSPSGIATSTPALAINTQISSQAWENQTRIEEAHILRQELRALNLLPAATTSTTTASSTSKETATSTATTTASTTSSASSTENHHGKIRILNLIQD